jgi:hypothetical protein
MDQKSATTNQETVEGESGRIGVTLAEANGWEFEIPGQFFSVRRKSSTLFFP